MGVCVVCDQARSTIPYFGRLKPIEPTPLRVVVSCCSDIELPRGCSGCQFCPCHVIICECLLATSSLMYHLMFCVIEVDKGFGGFL